MDKKCAICGKTHGLFTLEIEADDGTAFDKFICGSCWDVIAAIAIKAIKALEAKK